MKQLEHRLQTVGPDDLPDVEYLVIEGVKVVAQLYADCIACAWQRCRVEYPNAFLALRTFATPRDYPCKRYWPDNPLHKTYLRERFEQPQRRN